MNDTATIVTQSVNPDDLLRVDGELMFETGAGQLPVEVFQHEDLRWLRFGSAAIQSVMQVDSPQALRLAYLHLMMAPRLFCRSPKTAVLLGLGGGALVRHLYNEFQKIKLTAVECNPLVIDVCREFFQLPSEVDRFNVVPTDAFEFVRNYSGPAVDWLMVDVFGAEAMPAFLYLPAFYLACRKILATNGILVANLLVNSEVELVSLLGRIRQVFRRRTLCLQARDHMNVVVLAFPSAQDMSVSRLRHLGSRLTVTSGVDYSQLAENIVSANPEQDGHLV